MRACIGDPSLNPTQLYFKKNKKLNMYPRLYIIYYLQIKSLIYKTDKYLMLQMRRGAIVSGANETKIMVNHPRMVLG